MLIVSHINEFCACAVLDMTAFRKHTDCADKRESERLGALYALKGLLNTSTIEVVYDAYRKPFVSGHPEWHISISHSFDKLVVLYHTRISTGVDIEQIREKIHLIKHKFLSDSELAYCGEDAWRLTLFWSVKEAVYKAYGKKGLDFAGDIFVIPPVAGEDQLKATVTTDTFEKEYVVHFRELDNYIMACVIDEN